MKCLFIDLGRHYGGAEVYLTSLIEEMTKQGIECVLVARTGGDFADIWKQKKRSSKYIEVTFNIKSIYKVRKFIIDEKIDIIHINGINSGLFTRALFVKCHTITTVHSNASFDRIDKNIIIRKLFEKAENFCLKRTNSIIAVSLAISDLLVSRGIDQEKITVINHGIDKIDYPPKKFSNGELKMCFSGRLEKVKGPDVLINALARIRDLKWRCDFYGSGSEREVLETLCINNRIADKVDFKGFKKNIRDTLNFYDILIIPSRYEAFPFSLIEGMNARALIVCADVGGMRFVIDDGVTGFKFRVEDSAALADILRKVDQGREYLGRITNNAYTVFVNNYTKEKMIDKSLKEFRRVCNINV